MAVHAQARPIKISFGNLSKMPFSWDAPAITSTTFNQAVFDRLIDIDSDFRIRPGLLQRFSFSSELDGYVLELRPNLKFSNGRAVTSRDLEFSILRGFFSERDNYFGVYFGNISGTGAIKPGSPYRSGAVAGVKILDASRILVKLDAPNPSFLHSLANMLVRLVPQEELKEDLFTWKRFPVGAGDFAVVEIDEKTSSIKVASIGKGANSREYELIYTDDASESPDITFQERPDYQSRKFGRASTVTSIFFSNRSGSAKDINFRKSFAAAINVGQDLGPEGARELLPPDFWGRANPKSFYDTVTPFPGRTIHARVLNLASKPSSAKEDLIKRIQVAIQKLKADRDVSFTASKFLTEPGDQRADLFGFSVLVDYFDPLIMFNAFGPASPMKPIQLVGDAKFSALLNKAKFSITFEERLESVKNLSKYLVDQAYVVPIRYEYESVYFNPKTIVSLGDLSIPALIHLDQVREK